MFAKENNFYVNVGGGLPHQRTETKKIKLERQSSDLASLSSVGDLASLGLGSLVTSSVPDPGLYQIAQRQLRYIEWKGVKIYDFGYSCRG